MRYLVRVKMPMTETELLCPICRKPLTDVDGMLECQNVEYGKEWHFTYYPTNYGGIDRFNFEEWIKKELTRKK